MGQSVSISFNFNYRGTAPNFKRDSFDTLAEMAAYEIIDDGHISYCKETNKHYVFNSSNVYTATLGKWRESSVQDVLNVIGIPTVGDTADKDYEPNSLVCYDGLLYKLNALWAEGDSWQTADATYTEISVEIENLLGHYSSDTTELDVTACAPVNGKNYALGSISQLTFADSLAPMTLGSTIQFTASADFSIGVPTDANASTKSRIITDTSLDCTSGSEYVLFLSAVSTDPTDSAFSNPSYINLFSLVELNAPS